MNNKRLISLAVFCILAVVTVLPVLSFASNEPGTNTEARQLFEKANELRKLADYDAAIAEYNKVLNLSPDGKTARNAQYWIGQSHFEARQFDAALSAFQGLLDKYPASSIIPSTKQMIERVQQAKKNKSLFEAVKKADVEKVRLLIAEGADLDAKWGDTTTNKDERKSDNNPLCYAVESNNMDMVKLLVEAGADVNAGKWPPLSQAVDENNTAIAEYLIDHGANVNAPQDWGALQEAPFISNNIEMVKLLIARGADISTARNVTALQISIMAGRRDIFDLLIQLGADVNTKDYQGGFTPLYFAIHNDDTNFMNILIANGAEVNTKYPRGETLLQSAAITGRTESVKLLLEAGADINAKNDRGQTALHVPLDIRNSNYKKYKLSKDTLEY